MKRLLLILPTLTYAFAAAEQTPQLHVLHVAFDDSELTLQLAAMTDKALHEQCLRYVENPPETDEPEEDPARYEIEKEWAQEEGGYILVGRSCVTAVKADLKLTDVTGTVYTPKETDIKEENGILLTTLEFDLSSCQQFPQLDSLSISGSLEYAAHYNMESELTEPVDFSLPCRLQIGDYQVQITTQQEIECIVEEDDDEEEEYEEIEEETEEEEAPEEEETEEYTFDDSDEEYDASFYAEENEEKELDNDKDTPSGFIYITPIKEDNDLYNLITNVIIYTVEEGEMSISGTFGNGDIERFSWDYRCKENVLPQQGKISLRLRKKSHPRHYQFNQTLQVLPTK
ncbi:MAG: hypothetical protein IKZ10_04855 [Akkermansia sp.]|nr:hypothetical protein [Akkermansia sp.]